ncbi:MAG: bifunctional aspartate kinase/homoserine dehydrogenase I [Bacteroidales bacterium]|nr:bifunctional aspartate kinase/homoserine dehydrogenase I [Bacteroidales bacterium]
MKVLKFGGSSVATPDSIKKVRSIVKSQEEPVVVVVSALGGVTDELIRISALAESADASYLEKLQALRKRHIDACEAVEDTARGGKLLRLAVDSLLNELDSICRGVFLLKVLPEKTRDQILSFGERISSLIVTAAIGHAELYDSLDFIRMDGTLVDFRRTDRLVAEKFADYGPGSPVAIVPGFIARDAAGDIVTLGRGGSDYTASILAAALNASVLEIWTDVDGFMSADPRIIQAAYVINELSYEEATELCNFGAKVVYPPTLYPVCRKGIPIRVKNTFNPDAPGTLIWDAASEKKDKRAIKGISSIDNISLITISATSLMGIIGVDQRIFSALAAEHINVFLVSQSASETGLSIGVSAENAERACEVLSRIFAAEIESGSVHPVKREDELAAVAIVGENMKHNCGIAGKLFSILGRNGISIIACAQGASESNISFVVERKYLRKSLNVIHEGFFLSEYQELNLFICGVGTVGGQLIEQIAAQQEKLKSNRNLKINVVGIARSSRAVFDRDGLDLGGWKEALAGGIPIDPARLKEEILGMNIFNAVFVDCTASPEVAALYEDFFNHGISVVAANKIAASSDYGNYRRLKKTARRRGVKFLFETNVGAGLPIINTINSLRNSGDHVLKIEAVLSGTLNFIFNTISKDIPFSETVRMAKEQGYSEPDPRIDLSGKDVVRKLVILSREAGYEVNQEDVVAEPFIPREFFDCSLDDFWKKLPSLDGEFERRRQELEAGHKHWRFVAKMDNGTYTVSLRTFDEHHSFYTLDGSNNIVLLTTERYHDHPMQIQGYGAGASVTAAGVFADIISIANVTN